jgi:hypothetical protein
MESRSGFDRLWLGLGAVVLSIGVGIFAYSAGQAQALAQLPVTAVAPGTVAVPVMYYRPWGFGFIGPLFFLFVFWFLMLRVVAGRRRWGGPGGYYGHGGTGVPPMFEEWHRRAHAADSARSGTPQQ